MISLILKSLFAITLANEVSLAKSIVSHKVSGSYRDIKFIDYDMDLWTFTLKNNSIIDSTNFSISTRRHEAVKAFISNNLKDVEYLPQNISEKFPNLAIFEAQNCSIKSIFKENFIGLKKLVKLFVDYNEISEISADVFSDLERLKTLSLTFNKIHTIAAPAFSHMKSLQSLYLGHNKLKYLHKNLFENLVDLKNLSMNYNHLIYLDDEHLVKNENLEYIWLEHNDISHLSYTMFNYMNNLKFIDFTFNLHMWSGFVYEKN